LESFRVLVLIQDSNDGIEIFYDSLYWNCVVLLFLRCLYFLLSKKQGKGHLRFWTAAYLRSGNGKIVILVT